MRYKGEHKIREKQNTKHYSYSKYTLNKKITFAALCAVKVIL